MVVTSRASTSAGRHMGGPSAPDSHCALVAGANAQIRQLIRTVLEIGGFEVIEASTQGELLSRLSVLARVPHVVVLDVALPHFPGVPTLSFMRREARLCSVPVVVLTPMADAPDHALFQQYGATAVMCKPFSSQRLLETARSLATPTPH